MQSSGLPLEAELGLKGASGCRCSTCNWDQQGPQYAMRSLPCNGITRAKPIIMEQCGHGMLPRCLCCTWWEQPCL